MAAIPPLRIAFMGTSAFAVLVLEKILHYGFHPTCVFSQPARARGRGMSKQPTPLALCAQGHGLQVFTPANLDNAATLKQFTALELDVAIVVAYGMKLPQAILDIPRYGCINVHPSLLPRWRGAAPLQRALEAGDTQGGVCVIQMDAGIDTGPILAQTQVALSTDLDLQTWHDTSAIEGAALVKQVLENIANLTPTPQSRTGVTYAKMFRKDDLLIDFHQPAQRIINQIRAFSPKPSAWCYYQGKRLRLLSARIITQNVQHQVESGTIVNEQMMIKTGTDMIQPQKLQLEGRKAIALDDFLRGQTISVGTVLQGKPA